MEVVCPKCNALYRIADHKVPAQGAALTCKRCSHRISVKPLFHSGDTLKVPMEADGAVGQQGGVRDTLKVPLDNEPPVPAQAAVPAAATHPHEIQHCFPQAGSYDTQHYDLTEILVLNKKGQYNTRANRLKMKLLDAVKPVLDRLLAPGERVARVAPAMAYYPWEIILGNGWLTLLYNRYVMVATDQRVVAINTNARMTRATHYIFQFRYGSLQKSTRGMFGTSLVLTRKQAKRRIFNGIKRPMATQMRDWIAARINPQHPIETPTDQCEHLCPACYLPLEAGLNSCRACGAIFKSPHRAALRSLLLPGLGDIYLSHRFLGAFELMGALVIWIAALSLFASGQAENILFGLFLLLLVNGMDAVLTLHMGKKGYALEKNQSMGYKQENVRAGIAQV